LRQMQMLSHHHPPKKSPLSGRWTHHNRGNNNTFLLASLPSLEATKGPQRFEAERDLDSITMSRACDDGLTPMVKKTHHCNITCTRGTRNPKLKENMSWVHPIFVSR
jgi:hypothetical protein